MNKTKQNKTKQNKTKQNKTKQNKTKQNSLLCRYGLTSAAALLLTFGGASAVRADNQEDPDKVKAQAKNQLLAKLGMGLELIGNKEFPTPTPTPTDDGLDATYLKGLLQYLKERDKAENEWRGVLLKGMQDRLFDGLDGKQGETGPTGPAGPTGP
ncbi:TPA: peptidase, partial [Streptococcus pyogenes]